MNDFHPSALNTPQHNVTPECLAHYAADGHLVEQYRDDAGRHRFAHRLPGGELLLDQHEILIGGVLLRPLVNSITKHPGFLAPPPHPQPQDTAALFHDLFVFTEKYATWSPEFRVGAVAYAMATWLYPRFQFFGYLQFTGHPGKGKSRSLDVLAALCYHPVQSSSLTPAIIYRVVDRCAPTLLIDEIDSALHPDIRAILRNGTSRNGMVYRSRGEDFEPEGYSCFGPKVYAGQEPLNDPALISRIIPENMARVAAATHIGPTLPPEHEEEAKELRARLLRWALDNYWTLRPRDPGGPDLRQRQVFIPLFTVAPRAYDEELQALMERQRKTTKASMADTFDGETVAALRAMGLPEKIRPIEVAKVVCSLRGVEFDKNAAGQDRVTPERVGHTLKRLGLTDRRRDEKGCFYFATRSQLEDVCQSYLPEHSAAELQSAPKMAVENGPSSPGCLGESISVQIAGYDAVEPDEWYGPEEDEEREGVGSEPSPQPA